MKSRTIHSTRFVTLQDDRLRGDELADKFVEEIVYLHHPGILEELYKLLGSQAGFSKEALENFPETAREKVLQYFNQTSSLPLWVNTQKISHARKLFARFGPEMILMAFCSGLPYVFCGAKAAKVLYLSGNTQNTPGSISSLSYQVADDIQFFVSVLMEVPYGDENSRAVVALQKRRFLNAITRYRIRTRHVAYKPEDGLPLNQEDLAAVILAMGVRIIQGLEQMGTDFSQKDREAFLHTWNVAGNMLGVKESRLPVNYRDAIKLTNDIFDHQAAHSSEGVALMRAATDLMESILPGNKFDGVPALLVSFFNKPIVVDFLELNSDHLECEIWERLQLSPPLILKSNEAHRVMHHLANLVSKELVEGLIHFYQKEVNRSFELPQGQVSHWRPIRYGISLPENVQTFPEMLKHMDDLVHHFKYQNDVMGYYCINYQKTLQEISKGINSGYFKEPELIEHVCAYMTTAYFDVIRDYLSDREICSSWALILKPHLADSLFVDQYIFGGAVLHILGNMPQAFVQASQDAPLTSVKKDLSRLAEFYFAMFPDMSTAQLKLPSGAELELSKKTMDELREDFKELSAALIFDWSEKIQGARTEDIKEVYKPLADVYMELVKTVLYPTRSFGSILKASGMPEANHPADLQRLMTSAG